MYAVFLQGGVREKVMRNAKFPVMFARAKSGIAAKLKYSFL
jgi:hypothetical protein